MSDSTTQPAGPASLNPTSPGCILALLTIATLVLLTWFGLGRLKEASGDMAISAANNAVATSGLGAPTRAGVEAELERIEAAHHAGELDSRGVVLFVNEVLQTPFLPHLRLQQLLDVDLPSSGLPASEKEALDLQLRRLWYWSTQQAVTIGELSDALGLATTPPGAQALPLTDEELQGLRERTSAIMASATPPAVSMETCAWTPADPLQGLRQSADEAISGKL